MLSANENATGQSATDTSAKSDKTITTTLISAHEVGEVEIRSLLPLSAAQRAALAKIVAEEPEAKALFATLREEAQGLLKAQPRPLRVIHYEGLVNTDPRRLETVKHLEDMDDAAVLMEVWQGTGDPAYARKSREYVLSWASTYVPTGNDVNENKLQPLFTIYEAIRGDFSTDEQARIDAWLSDIVQKQMQHGRDAQSRRTNRHTKRLRIVATVGLALAKQEWLDYTWAGFKEFVEHNLYADGTSYDLKHRDTLTYHNSALRPLLDLAILAARDGERLYEWVSPTGSSLQKSVRYVLPYADGTKQRREWENSEVELDHRRAAAGLQEYQPGSLFEPKRARALLEEAAFFEADFVPLVAKLADSKATRYPTWRTVSNEASGRALAATAPLTSAQ